MTNSKAFSERNFVALTVEQQKDLYSKLSSSFKNMSPTGVSELLKAKIGRDGFEECELENLIAKQHGKKDFIRKLLSSLGERGRFVLAESFGLVSEPEYDVFLQYKYEQILEVLGEDKAREFMAAGNLRNNPEATDEQRSEAQATIITIVMEYQEEKAKRDAVENSSPSLSDAEKNALKEIAVAGNAALVNKYGHEGALGNVFATALQKVNAKIDASELTTEEQVNASHREIVLASKVFQKVLEASHAEKAKAEADAQAKAERAELLPAVLERLEAESAGKRVCMMDGFTVDQFLAINNYPFNRDTIARLKKAHLNGEIKFDLQAEVAVVKLDEQRNAALWLAVMQACEDNGEACSLPWIKFDGHSRSEAWNAGVLAKPAELFVKAYQGEQYTDEHIEATVKVFGSPASDISVAEHTQMANKALGLDFESDFAKKSWKGAYRYVLTTSEHGAIKEEKQARSAFKSVFEWINTFGLKSSYAGKKNGNKGRYIVTGIKAGILNSFIIAEEEEAGDNVVKAFWADFFKVVLEDEPEFTIAQVKALIKWIDTRNVTTSAHGGTYDKELTDMINSTIRKYCKAVKKTEQAA